MESFKVFLNQPVFIEVDPPVRICGDMHGQYGDLLRLLYMGGFPPHSNYLFLGDYVDRGSQSLVRFHILFWNSPHTILSKTNCNDETASHHKILHSPIQ